MVLETINKSEECLGIRCIWYDPWEADCIGDHETLSNCPCNFFVGKNQERYSSSR
jgi:hypothetical protein